MGFRLRKSIKILPGVRLNLSKKGVGTSVGFKGFHVSSGPSGKRTTSSIPGTGVSFITQSGKSTPGGNSMESTSAFQQAQAPKVKQPLSTRKKVIIALVIGVPLVLCCLISLIGMSTPEYKATATAKALATAQAAIPTITMTKPPTATSMPSLTPTIFESPMPSPTPECNCSIDYNCPDFVRPADAQFCFNQCGGSTTSNWAGLDADGDGYACEYQP